MHVPALIDPSFAVRFTTTLLHFLWQGCLIALLASAAGVLMRRAAARRRYLLNVAALLLMAASVPLTFYCVGPPAPPATNSALLATAPANRDVPLPGQNVVQPPETLSSAAPQPVAAESREDVESISRSLPADPAVVAAAASEPAASTAEGFGIGRAVRRWAPQITALYFLGFAVLLVRLIHGAAGGRRLRRKSVPVTEAALIQALWRQSGRFGVRVAPALAWCAEISTAVVVGVVKPIILLPAAAATGLSFRQLESLIMHELAHIRRYDAFANLLQRLIESALFFHPAVWYVSRRADGERELACDELVLRMGCEPAVYADSLVRTAELSSALRDRRRAVRATSLSAGGARPSELKRRVLKILGVAETPRMRSGEIALLMAAVALPAALAFLHVSSAARATEPASANRASAGETENESRDERKNAGRAREPERQASSDKAGVVGSWNESLPATGDSAAGSGPGAGGDDPPPDDETPVPAPAPDPKLLSRPLERQVSPDSPPVWATSTRETSYFGNWIKGPLFLDRDQILWGTSIINASTGELIGTFPFGQDADLISNARLSGNRKYLLVEGTTRTDPRTFVLPAVWLQVWNVETRAPAGRPITLDVHGDVDADVTGDGKTVAIASSSEVALWNGITGKKTKTLPVDLADFETGYQGRPAFFRPEFLKFSPDDRWLVTFSPNEVVYWQWQTEHKPRVLHAGRRLEAFAFTSDGRYLAEGPGPRTNMHVREMSSFDIVRTLFDEVDSPMITSGLAFTPGGKTLIATNDITVDENKLKIPHRIHFWNVKTGRLVRQMATPVYLPRYLDVSPDGKWLAVRLEGDGRTVLAVWSIEE